MRFGQRALAVFAVTVASLLAAASPAYANAGGGIDTTFAAGGRQVTGSGAFVVELTVNSNSAQVTFECSVVATPDAVSTFVRPPDKDGCQFFKGDTLIAEADGVGAPGPAASTSKRATVDLALPGRFMICWKVGAVFRDGTVVPNENCKT